MYSPSAVFNILIQCNFFYRDSVNDISGYRKPKLPGRSNTNKAEFHGSKKGGKNKRNQRYGKIRRQKSKHGKK